jgi:EAL domain-containing protein (putative c-di-GMP-specific phosphodiesterase class I)/ActR/RegA family two-component response regulator
VKSLGKVLVIDDEEEICSLIAGTAAGLNMACVATSDPDTFLQALQDGDIRLIVIDLLMPELDGIEILRLLGKQGCKAGIILMSGIGKRVIETAENLATELGLSVVGQLSKPFSILRLEALLQRAPKPIVEIQEKGLGGPEITGLELGVALEQQQFRLEYQPQIEVVTGRCLGMEALVRWEHPRLGRVQPDHFIACAEEAALIDQLTWFVIRQGMTEMGNMSDKEGNPLLLSFNVSVSSLRDLKFPDNLIALADECGVLPKNLILEITESGFISQLSQTLDVLSRLRLKRVRLSIDDFGAGYSMMQQLRHVPANEVKIDRSLMHNLHTDSERIMVEKIIELCRDLDLISVAEGVETQDQFDFLRRKGCDVAQGYFFSKPLAKEPFLKWLEEYQKAPGSYSGRI